MFMKEQFEKMKKTLGETLELLKTQKGEEALAKLSETIDAVELAEKEFEKTSESMKKTSEENASLGDKMEKIETEMRKWADLYVSWKTLTEVLEDLKAWITESMKKMQEDMQKTILELPQWSKQVTKTTWVEPERGLWDSVVPGK